MIYKRLRDLQPGDVVLDQARRPLYTVTHPPQLAQHPADNHWIVFLDPTDLGRAAYPHGQTSGLGSRVVMVAGGSSFASLRQAVLAVRAAMPDCIILRMKRNVRVAHEECLFLLEQRGTTRQQVVTTVRESPTTGTCVEVAPLEAFEAN